MSKVQTFINLVCQMCDDNSHGYDQTNRWGPNFDCTSLCYYCANKAGYAIKTGSGYSGTLCRDFVAAGWTAVPFGKNSAITGLTPGSIMLREGHHAEVVLSANQWGGAHINETGTITGGQSGDQTGREISRCAPYHYGTYPNDWDYIMVPPAEEKSSSTSSGEIVFTYRVRTEKKGWLPAVTNLTDYAGIENDPITDIAIKCNKGRIAYQVHNVGGGWLPNVSGYNISDSTNGYAGNHKRIDALRVVLYGVDGSNARYRVSPIGSNSYYDWQNDAKKTASMDGYAGVFGKPIDKVQIY